jgi:hypothetical protein
VYNKTVPDDDFIKSKHVVIETQVFLLVVLTDKIKSIVYRVYPAPLNSVHTLPHVFFSRTVLVLSSHLRQGPPSGLFLSDFTTKIN